ncbi:glutamine-hydrolyzing carbamoyl-phosphate synthase small subunit [Haliangium ochraceum]|uniref:Carbamoyl phosphate synthase small chain n=1 Tax=Haliangium ochraceum (strain DSM 14365 / JCM 11303 / SMP-2) TaxID=502025 RepID=D0LI67_HALO1|nr:glutamine-hydrolyzing carbamoyl-phosphate synthase small subunit [Haliangium ochraceum]ACY16446.1 carbamoyl-phosphate synthase, small subunit [Haliangium ochraceum DSM 14365]
MSHEEDAREDALLLLESGRVFRGRALGARGKVFGEAVFNTSMTGYQEIVTDPSYSGQIVVMTAPQIGNTGINREDIESAKPMCAGFAVREASPLASSWRASGELDEYLRASGIVGIEGIDTRALTRALRTAGAQRAVVASGAHDDEAVAALLAEVREAPHMNGLDLASRVTCAERYQWPPSAPEAAEAARQLSERWLPASTRVGADTREDAGARFHVVAYDFGMKHNILACLARLGCRVTVVPASTSAADALALAPDGVFLSNGPGDPAAVGYAVEAVAELAASGKPLFGICLGHQILALALGASTYKLPFGHHGGNHPVQDLASKRIEISAHNHGFAVAEDSLPETVRCTHRNLYDDTVEGIELVGAPVFGIQYHPEASPGPHDALGVFDRFVDAMASAQGEGGTTT